MIIHTLKTILVLVFSGPMYVSSNDAIAQTNSSDRTDVQPNINAESVFNTKTMTPSKNVQTLVILIPMKVLMLLVKIMKPVS
jgi:hypothetical protein